MNNTNRPAHIPPAQTYLLSCDADGNQIISIHVKRSYCIEPSGKCVREAQQGPLLLFNPSANPNEFNETDIVPFKKNTDLIVMAYAWGNGERSMTAGIRVDALNHHYTVFGNRQVSYRGPGKYLFSPPEPFEKMGMCYENAYGGVDDSAGSPEVKHIIDMFSSHPGVYPRNPVGKGYVVYDSKARIDDLQLPNIEHPEMLLSPCNLVVGHPHNWWKAPLPWSCEWFDKSWYPRVAHYSGIPEGIPKDDSCMPEVQNGWIHAGHATQKVSMEDNRFFDAHIGDAATPALVLPYMKGNETIELRGLTPERQLNVQLPNDIPTVSLRFGGKTTKLNTVPHRVLVSTIEHGVYIVWHAQWRPPKMFPRKPVKPDDGLSALVAGIDVFVDNEQIKPLGSK